MEKYPKLAGEAEEYEMTREELIENFWKKIKLMNELEDGKWITDVAEHASASIFVWSGIAQNIDPLQPH